MREQESKAYQHVLEKLKEVLRANETPEQGMKNFEKFIKDTSTSGTANRLKKAQEKIVEEELKHIPDGVGCQNELRMIYHTRRMHSLGKKAESKQTAKEVLEQCITCLKDDYPDFQFTYDDDFFNKGA